MQLLLQDTRGYYEHRCYLLNKIVVNAVHESKKNPKKHSNCSVHRLFFEIFES